MTNKIDVLDMEGVGKDLKTKVNRVFYIAYLAFFIVVTAFVAYFYSVNDFQVSKDISHWGAAGDFIGGFLNPFFSVLVILLLVQSYFLQKIELRKTVEALEGSASDAKRQADISRIQGQINILISEVDGKRAILLNLNEEIRRIASVTDHVSGHCPQILTMDGASLSDAKMRREYVVTCVQVVNELHEDLERLMDSLSGLNTELADLSS